MPTETEASNVPRHMEGQSSPVATGFDHGVAGLKLQQARVDRSRCPDRNESRCSAASLSAFQALKTCWKARGDRFGKRYCNAGLVTREDFLTAVVAPIGNGLL